MSISISTSDRPAPPALAEPGLQRVRALQSPAPTQAPSAQAASAKARDPQQMREELRKAVDRLNEHMQKLGRNLSFSMDEKIDRTIIRVTDKHTGEVVRQIPDETMIRVAHSLEDFKGLLHNEWT